MKRLVVLVAAACAALALPAAAQEGVPGGPTPAVAASAVAAPAVAAPAVAASALAQHDVADLVAFARNHADAHGSGQSWQARVSGQATGTWARAAYERALTQAAGYWDTCRDTAGALDARTVVVVENTDTAALGFFFDACRAFSVTDIGEGGVVYPVAVPGGRGDAFDYVVVVYHDAAAGGLRVSTVATPSDDPATWVETYQGPAARLDDHGVHGIVPTSALGLHTVFAFGATAVDAGDRPDYLPEVHEDLLVFPYSCDTTTARRATVRTERGHFDEAVAAAHAAGYAVRSPVPQLGVFEVLTGARPDVARLRALPGVTAAAPAVAFRRAALNTPDDPAFARQWALEAIKAPQGWLRRSGSGLTVAVLDDGVDGTRADVRGRVLAGRDTMYDVDLPAGTSSDRGGHGTAVTGVLAAAGNNSIDMAGVDWTASIIPYRIFDASACATDASVAAAFADAADRGADVINFSVGTDEHSDALQAGVRYAQQRGVLVVTAVGNSKQEGNPVSYPAAYDGVVAVGATTRTGGIAAYSNTGPHVDLVAPGGAGAGDDDDVLTFGERESLAPNAGTSFAAPQVAAAALLFLAHNPGADSAAVADALTATAADLGPAGRDDTYGAGLLDLEALLAVGGSAPAGPVVRVGTSAAPATAVAISQARFTQDQASHVVLSRDDVFADSLAGAPLTAAGPLLLTDRTQLEAQVGAEIDRVLEPGATVYLLGGPGALSDEVSAQVAARGYTVRRLAGSSRVETAVGVAQEVRRLYPQGTRVALARAFGTNDNPTAAWADSVTGGAWAARDRVPLLVTDSASVHPAVAAALRDFAPTETVLLGGAAALSADVERAVPNPRRVSGSERAATAVQIAAQLWPSPAQQFVVVHGYRVDGWAFGLAAAGLAADRGAPALLSDTADVPAATLAAVRGAACGDRTALVVVGDGAVIGAAAEAALGDAATTC